jgi:oligopeptidase A
MNQGNKMNNPLLLDSQLPPFEEIKSEHIAPALDLMLAENRKTIAALTAQSHFTWENLIKPLDECQNKLANLWSPVSHLHSVKDSPELRKAYEESLPKLSDYSTEIMQNEALFKAFEALKNSPEFPDYSQGQKKVIENTLRDFKLAGVALPADQKQSYADLKKELSELATKFSNNVLDVTDQWYLNISEDDCAGLPPHALTMFAEKAKAAGLKGNRIGIDAPSYIAVMTYANSRELREKVYTAYITRASDRGPHGEKWNNSQNMREILKRRKQLAQLLDFQNYSELSLATKMAREPEEVRGFLDDLGSRAKKQAEKEFTELQAFAKQNDCEKLKPWDIAYYSEKLRESRYSFSEEDLRPYFPVDQILSGLFEIVSRLYGIQISEEKSFSTWHPDVRLFTIRSETGEIRGQFYFDLFARAAKRGGAWMDECRLRYTDHTGKYQHPVAYLTCNFSPASAGEAPTLTHDEALTLFHEFGHGLHHMLTKVEYLSITGINGVPWDAVELPSQFMEHWCWQKDALNLITQHVKTKTSLPDDLLQKALSARNFQSALFIVRQLELALFDWRLHAEFEDNWEAKKIQELLNEVRAQVAVLPIVEFNRFAHSFTHVFAGGYAAGYYSYLWAEVLADDAFSKFEENGIFDAKTGREFLTNILEKGGSAEPQELFVAFRGRPATNDAFLKYHGIG